MKRKENNQSCNHLDQTNQNIDPKTPDGCEECLQTGSSWLHLRLCLTCGHVGCCDNSINKHGTKHFHLTGHPVIKSYEPGENWEWCFVDEIFSE
jgi:ubiquitin-hydrolase Zn-finger-containing protein